MTVCFISAYVNGFDVARCIVLVYKCDHYHLNFIAVTTFFYLKFVNALLKRKILSNGGWLEFFIEILSNNFSISVHTVQYVIIVIYFKILFTSPTAANKCQSIKSSCCSQTGGFYVKLT